MGLARPSIHPSVPCELSTRKLQGTDKTRLGVKHFSVRSIMLPQLYSAGRTYVATRRHILLAAKS